MPAITVVEGDITTLTVDAIVNAANSRLLGGGGVDGAIHRAGGTGDPEACEVLRNTSLPDGLPVGAAVATTAGKLHAKAVIHTVGPRYSRSEDRSGLLRSAYTRSLAVADSIGARTVAFPLISAGGLRLAEGRCRPTGRFSDSRGEDRGRDGHTGRVQQGNGRLDAPRHRLTFGRDSQLPQPCTRRDTNSVRVCTLDFRYTCCR